MTIKEVSSNEAKNLIAQGWILVDVRSPGEWSAVHAVGAINLPLSDVSKESLARVCGDKKRVLAICQAGGRSKKACEAMSSFSDFEVASVIGGTADWESRGLPVERGRGVISIERQVRIIAGLLVLVGSLLGIQVSSGFFAIPIFVGVGLTFAGVTDFCGMGILLAKMPWNQGQSPSCKV